MRGIAAGARLRRPGGCWRYRRPRRRSRGFVRGRCGGARQRATSGAVHAGAMRRDAPPRRWAGAGRHARARDTRFWLAVGAEVLRQPIDTRALGQRLTSAVASLAARSTAAWIAGPQGLALDYAGRAAYVDRQPLGVTRLEFDLLRLLLARRGEVIATDELAPEVRGYRGGGQQNYIETRISRLRSKLRSAGVDGLVENMRGVGYVIRSQLPGPERRALRARSPTERWRRRPPRRPGRTPRCARRAPRRA
ncbi:MAG: winged helix family transcriptional regulator [Dehalococcoidia bacterium]|nr:winged helix family transcriptional regulator [Dehalococcoidia bacterium]